MTKEIKRLQEDKKTKKKGNAQLLLQSERLEEEVQRMENITQTLDSVYKELLVLNEEFKSIKKNAALTGEKPREQKGAERSRSDAYSIYSNDMDVMMGDFPEDTGEGLFLDDEAGPMETLKDARAGSLSSETLYTHRLPADRLVTPTGKSRPETQRRDRTAQNNKKGQEDACCLIF